MNTPTPTRFTAPQLRFMRDLLDDEGRWSGMWTCRRNRRTTAIELDADGFITPILLAVTDDDGFTVEPERYRFGWRLTDAGVIAIHAEAPDKFSWVTQSGKHARPDAGAGVMDPEKRDRWLALVADKHGPIERVSRVCACGAEPDGTESHGTGDYIGDDGQDAWICLACWCAENYGSGALETLAARRDARRRERDVGKSQT